MTDAKIATLLSGIIAIVYGCFLAIFSPEELPMEISTSSYMPYLFDKPVGEDGFYMLGVAWNIALGKGIVGNFDKAVTGVQPLATFVFAALAWVVQTLGGGKAEFVRAFIIFGTLNFVLFAHQMGRLTTLFKACKQEDLLYGIAFIVTCSSFYIFRLFTYGLETGIYLTLFAELLIYWLRSDDECFRGSYRLLIFGALIGLCGLARIDFGVIYAVFLLYVFARLRQYALFHVASGAIGALATLPWFAYVYAVSGSLMPSSGSAQAAAINLDNSSGRLFMMFDAVLENLMPLIFTGHRSYMTLLSFSSLAALAYLARPNILLGLARVGGWVASVGFLCMVYLFFIGATHFFARYTSPILLFSIPLISSAIYALYFASVRETIFKFSFFSGAIFWTFSLLSLHGGKIGNAHSISAGYIARNMPEATIGAFQSGVIGYVNKNVVNLDGKVNTDILPYVRRGNVDGYLSAHREINVLIDWPAYFGFISPEFLASGWEKCIDGSTWGSVGYCRKVPNQ